MARSQLKAYRLARNLFGCKASAVKIILKKPRPRASRPKHLRCTRCGSVYVRRAHPNLLDYLTRLAGLTTFRCLSCYRRFRVFHPAADTAPWPTAPPKPAASQQTPSAKKTEIA